MTASFFIEFVALMILREETFRVFLKRFREDFSGTCSFRVSRNVVVEDITTCYFLQSGLLTIGQTVALSVYKPKRKVNISGIFCRVLLFYHASPA